MLILRENGLIIVCRDLENYFILLKIQPMKDFGRKICLMEKALYIKMELFKMKLKFKLIIKIFQIRGYLEFI